MKTFRFLFVSIAVFLLCTSARADVSVPAVFSDHMVLQRRMEVPIWGSASANEKIRIELDSSAADDSAKPVIQSTQADANGKWRASLKAMEAGGPYTLKIQGESGKPIEISDILFGEVWLCSGQSNMEFQVWKANNGKAEADAATNKNIRLLRFPHRPATIPTTDVPAEWTLCDPKTATPFSAVGYFFGRELESDLHVPIGLIQSTWGGTAIASWTRRQVYNADPALRSILSRPRIAGRITDPATRAATHPATAPALTPFAVGNLFNGMIHPLIPYGIRGVIWYQGEANATRAKEYSALFPAMIRDWRTLWNEGDFPFLYVQLAAFGDKRPPSETPRDSFWAELREAQTKTLSTPNTGMALAIDTGEEDNIHPKKKQEVAHRLALVARATVYGEKVDYAGPTFDTMKIDGHQVRLTFTHATGLKTKDSAKPLSFAIAGADKHFVNANATIDGDTIIVESPDVPDPAAVRYAWDYYPHVNLYNSADVPMVPFRTDDWPTPAPNVPDK